MQSEITWHVLPWSNNLRWDTIKSNLTSSLEGSTIKTIQDFHNLLKTWNPQLSSLDAFGQFLVKQKDFTESFFQEIVPLILKKALEAENYIADLHSFTPQTYEQDDSKQLQTQTITLTRNAVLSIMSLTMLCTFNHEGIYCYLKRIHLLDQDWLLQDMTAMQMLEKPSPYRLLPILQYFVTMAKKQHDEQFMNQQITFTRMKLSRSVSDMVSASKVQKLPSVSFESQRKNTNDVGFIVFADAYIGGGALDKGVGQEEFTMLHHTETLASMLFMEKMDDNEAIIIRGTVSFPDLIPSPEFIFIDALPFQHSKLYGLDQYSQKDIDREIMKALVGFIGSTSTTVVTAAWGCGTFGGDVELKFLIQWLALALASDAETRKLIYDIGWSQMFPNFEKNASEIVKLMENTTPATLYHNMIDLASLKRTSLFGTFKKFVFGK